MPEALVNLGIAYEKKGEHAEGARRVAPRRARLAREFAPLDEWIEAKERIYGEGAMKALVIAILLARGLDRERRQAITVGLFAPTAPFPSTSARVELASKLGDQLGKASAVPAAARCSRARATSRRREEGRGRPSRSSTPRTSRSPAVTTP